MTKPTDETLMAYADGLLDPSQRTQIEGLCAEDPALRARLQVFRATGRSLGGLLQDHVNAPVPKRLLDFVSAQEAKLAARNGPRRSRFWSRLKEHAQTWRYLDPSSLRTAVVAGAAMIAGIGLGWLLRGDSGGHEIALTDLVKVENSHLIARAPLRHALDSLVSGKQTRLALSGPENVQLKVKMTFRNEARDYCRAYEIVIPSPERYAGVACRMGGQWSVRIQAMIPPSSVSPNQSVPAGVRSSTMEAVVSAIIDGDPLSAPDEAAVIAEGWKK